MCNSNQLCGHSSAIERRLPKPDVGGLNPPARFNSKFILAGVVEDLLDRIVAAPVSSAMLGGRMDTGQVSTPLCGKEVSRRRLMAVARRLIS